MGKRSYEPDPKPGKDDKKPGRTVRKIDPPALLRKLMADTMCRATGNRATTGHHILLRSQGGDDVEDNILPLSDPPHRTYHDTGRLEGVELTEAEFEYLVGKLGRPAAVDYVKRKFGMEAE